MTKWNARVTNPRIVPEVVRKAFKVAQSQKPGTTHLELPEDVMASDVDAEPLPVPDWIRRPQPSDEEMERAAAVICDAERPIVLVGNGVTRVGAAQALRDFSHSTGIPVAETFMGKGAIDADDDNALGTVGLQSRDYALAGFEEADVVITVGYDLVEHSPEHWNPRRDKRIVVRRHDLGRGRRLLPDRRRPGGRHRVHPPPAHRAVRRQRLERRADRSDSTRS